MQERRGKRDSWKRKKKGFGGKKDGERKKEKGNWRRKRRKGKGMWYEEA